MLQCLSLGRGVCRHRFNQPFRLPPDQEELIPFFSQIKLSPQSDTAEKAYLELAEKVSH